MTPPKDHVLRAMMLICGAKDLTPGERTGLFVLWKFLRGEHKPIGPSLLGYLTSTSRGQAKQILHGLQVKKYLGSDGTKGSVRRRTAVRWITNKLPLPTLKRLAGTNRSQNRSRLAGANSSRLAGASADCKSDNAGRLTCLRQDDPRGKTKTPPAAVPISDTPENEIDAVNLGEVMASTPSAKGKAVGRS